MQQCSLVHMYTVCVYSVCIQYATVFTCTHVYSVFVYSVCMQYAVCSVQHTVCSACVQRLYTVCVYSVCIQYTVCSVQYTVCSACVQCLYTVCLVCLGTSPHVIVCLVTQWFCVLLCGWERGLVAGLAKPSDLCILARPDTGEARPRPEGGPAVLPRQGAGPRQPLWKRAGGEEGSTSLAVIEVTLRAC